jgi:hypothetical protein
MPEFARWNVGNAITHACALLLVLEVETLDDEDAIARDHLPMRDDIFLDYAIGLDEYHLR